MKVENNPASFENMISNSSGTLSEKEKKQLEEACKSFEAYFLTTLMSKMRATVQSENKDQAREVFESWLDTQLSEEMAKTGQLGLAKMLFEQVLQQQKNKEEAE